jgi:hypothetical protein
MNYSFPQYLNWTSSPSATTKRFREDQKKFGEDDSIQSMVKRMRVNDSLPSSPHRFSSLPSNLQSTNPRNSYDHTNEMCQLFDAPSQSMSNYESFPLEMSSYSQTVTTSQFPSEATSVRGQVSLRELRQLQFRQQEEARHSLLEQQSPGQESKERGVLLLAPSYPMNALLGSLHQERRRERVNQRVLLPTDSQLF